MRRCKSLQVNKRGTPTQLGDARGEDLHNLTGYDPATYELADDRLTDGFDTSRFDGIPGVESRSTSS